MKILACRLAGLPVTFLTKSKGSSEENEFHTCVRVCRVEGRGKSLCCYFSFVCEKNNPEESTICKSQRHLELPGVSPS